MPPSGNAWSQPCTPDDAARALAARFARDAYASPPTIRQIRLLYLTTMLDAAAYANGLDNRWTKRIRPLSRPSSSAPRRSTRCCNTPWRTAIRRRPRRRPGCSGEIGKADELLDQGDKPAPLVWLQIPTAGCAWRRWKRSCDCSPTKPFAGSSYVPSALGFFAASSGVRQAWSAARASNRPATWPGCSRRPASRPTRPPPARSCCRWPRDRPTTSWR